MPTPPAESAPEVDTIRTVTKPATPAGDTHTNEPAPDELDGTTDPPKEQEPAPSDEPTTVTSDPPETRPTEGRTDSAKPPSEYENDAPLTL